jgi:hypothetical protein
MDEAVVGRTGLWQVGVMDCLRRPLRLMPNEFHVVQQLVPALARLAEAEDAKIANSALDPLAELAESHFAGCAVGPAWDWVAHVLRRRGVGRVVVNLANSCPEARRSFPIGRLAAVAWPCLETLRTLSRDRVWRRSRA